MNKLILALLVISVALAVFAPLPSFAEVEQTRNASGVVTDVSTSNPLPINIASTLVNIGSTPPYTQSGVATAAHLDSQGSVNTNIASGSFVLSGTLPLQYWAIGAPTVYTVALATNTAYALTNLASFSANTYAEIQANAKIHFAAPGTLTATTTMQFCPSLAAGEAKGWRIGTSTFNLSLVADATAPASLTLAIYPLY